MPRQPDSRPTTKQKDPLTPEQRHYCMSRIQGKNTKPELQVRKGLFALGYRYQLHRKDLPGKPDIVLPKYNAVIFVHGCFWHGHDCHLFKWPKTKREFWKNKIVKNQANDDNAKNLLLNAGWRVAIIWECALKGSRKKNLDLVVHETDEWLKSLTSAVIIRGKQDKA